MGIKGIYQELGPARRISLSKLAVDKFVDTGRPLRLAIDVSIWQFQAQAAKGGANPSVRTLFYRLARLLGLGIQAVFVFDGPNKPKIKRKQRSGSGDKVATATTKRLIRLFGFHIHDAPGEAEAECALLQGHDLVDAVLSEDVDTLMFGGTVTLRNWSSEGLRSNQSPTHVSLYDVNEMRLRTRGLDREGLVLVALMSGGDYLPAGIPGCGPKLACEAARAGFGKSLCRIGESDRQSLDEWKEMLLHELHTNESGFFRTKHQSLSLPENFPNPEALRYYTNPRVSPVSDILRLRETWWRSKVDVTGLRVFTAEHFDWTHDIGDTKFIRVLASHLLMYRVFERAMAAQPETEPMIIQSSKRRRHFSVDGMSEVRVSYVPTEVVGISRGIERPNYTCSHHTNSTPGQSIVHTEIGQNIDDEPPDPRKPDYIWIPEAVLRLGMPDMIAAWQSEKAEKAAVSPAKRPKGTSDIAGQGTLDHWVRTSKPDKRPSTAFAAIHTAKAIPPKPPVPQLLARAPVTATIPRERDLKIRSKRSILNTAASAESGMVGGSHDTARAFDLEQPAEVIIISSSPTSPSTPTSSAPLRDPITIKPPPIFKTPPQIHGGLENTTETYLRGTKEPLCTRITTSVLPTRGKKASRSKSTHRGKPAPDLPGPQSLIPVVASDCRLDPDATQWLYNTHAHLTANLCKVGGVDLTESLSTMAISERQPDIRGPDRRRRIHRPSLNQAHFMC